jgi:hypothetical protein
MLNTDEKSWKLLNHSFRTAAERRAEGISCLFGGETPKPASQQSPRSTRQGGVNCHSGQSRRGKTEHSEATLRQYYSNSIANRDLVRTHRPSGWTIRDVALSDLHWLSDLSQAPLVLVWDLYSAQRDQQVRELAKQLGIQLIFIPPGSTDECQPLDRGIFGNLKQRSRRRFDTEILRGSFEHVCVGRGVRLLLLLCAWMSITQDETFVALEHLRPGDTS